MNYARNMHQTLTYWAPGVPDEYGDVSFSAPVQVACRWEDKAEVFKDAEGNELTSSAIVYPAEPLLRQGWVFLGTSAAADPRAVTDAHEIKQIGRTFNLAGTVALNKVFL